MELQFLPAKNGQTTCTADGRFLHSSYNPEMEAVRFAQSVPHSFEPAAIIVLGACLPFCAAPLRAQFPAAKLIAVQFDRRFSQFSDGWDSVFYISTEDENSQIRFETELFNLLGEEKLVTSQFVSWKASEAVWPECSRIAWEAVKSCMEKAQSVLTTRNWFNVRWYKNTVRSLSSIKKFCIPEKTDAPVLITASGPSLSKTLPFIRKNRNCFILIAASSSITTLLSNDIVPDFCISTDGGWYATRHLRAYLTDPRLKNVPLIISAESAVPSSLFSQVPFVLLSYGDAVETILSEQIEAPSVKGLRNGTVSGTAASFAASLTSGKVYICGLDLAPGKGFQHTEPNENDVPLFTGQTRINTLETTQASSRFASGSLVLYREWFSSQNKEFTSRVFRLLSQEEPLEKLGTMEDVYFEQLNISSSNAHVAFSEINCHENAEDIIKQYLFSAAEYISKNPFDEKCSLWYASLSLKQYINALRMNNDDKIAEYVILSEKTAAIIKEVAENV